MRKPTAFVYTRVSSEHQVQSGLSLDYGEETLTAIYKQRLADKYDWGGVYREEAVSAIKVPFANRKQGALLLAAIQPGDCILISRIDRAFRTMRDMVKQVWAWDDQKIRVVCPDFPNGEIDLASPNGKVSLYMSGVWAEMEGDRIKQRCKERSAQQRATGRAGGRDAPAGFCKVRFEGKVYIYPEPDERRFMAHLVRWSDDGHPVRAIANHIRNLGVKFRGKSPEYLFVWKLIRHERRLRELEAGVSNLSKDFVTPSGVVVSISKFSSVVDQKKEGLVRSWRETVASLTKESESHGRVSPKSE